MSDLTVHGRTPSGWPIIRLDRAGKWYVEAQNGRQHVTLADAAWLAAHGEFTPGLPGGRFFDRQVRAYRAQISKPGASRPQDERATEESKP